MAESEVVELRRHADLRPARDGDVIVSASVGPTNAAVVVWSTHEGRSALQSRTGQPGGASFPDPAPVPAYAYTLTMDATGVTASVTLTDLHAGAAHVS